MSTTQQPKEKAHQDTLPQVVKCPQCGTDAPSSMLACDGCGATLRTSKLREPGTVLGSYRLLDVLGEGGMGVVYLAEHTRLGRRVAIKMLRTEYGTNAHAVHRFFSEARAVNRICHQNIVEITDFVERPGGDNYYIMELLQGTSLAKLVDTQGIPTLARSVGIMVQVASALHAVHAAGIVHRDLKPDNVYLIERSGQKDFVKLLDFGVAKLGQINDVIAVHNTAAGAILGTPEYMSPEQASGKVVDFRTDLYAFGVMMYELVTGKLPLIGSSFGELVVKHLTVAPTPPRSIQGLPHVVPAALDDVILACLAKDPADRPDTIRTVSDRLVAIADAEGWELTSFGDSPRITGKQPVLQPLQRTSSSPSVEEAPAVPRRKSYALPLSIALAASLALALGYFLFGRGGDKPPDDRTVEIAIESTPKGASVFRSGETKPFGKTPLTLELPRSDRADTFELRLAGHHPVAHTVRLDRPSALVLTLRPVKVAPPPPPPVVAPVVIDPPPPPVEVKPVRKRPTRSAKKVAKPDPKPDPPPNPTPANPGDRSGVLNPFEPK